MSIPALTDPADEEYIWYVGDPVATVGLWRREGDTEFPVYQQTRGQAVFNSRRADESTVDAKDPTEAFFRALRTLDNGDYDPESDGGLDVEGCEWYEVEFLDKLFRFMTDHEPSECIVRLFMHAQVRDDGGDA